MFGSRRLPASGLVLLLVVTGCGGSGDPKLNHVAGKVTLDGEPLQDAIVSFLPSAGPPSGAITDEEGNYQLRYKSGSPGAIAGTHTVTISTDREGRGNPADEKVPEKYNKNTTLSVVVTEGDNEHDFPLTTR